jgi:hypothetical protein
MFLKKKKRSVLIIHKGSYNRQEHEIIFHLPFEPYPSDSRVSVPIISGVFAESRPDIKFGGKRYAGTHNRIRNRVMPMLYMIHDWTTRSWGLPPPSFAMIERHCRSSSEVFID